ncbi:MAG TPA: DUF2182 domain-containing protein [Tahibacter sp.]|nr:DUF2182 domain-containing protein [Tahibacter sp.]
MSLRAVRNPAFVPRGAASSRRMAGASAFVAITALLFAAGVAATAQGCLVMAEMPAMAMPGGWRMDMAWMRMPGQSALAANAAFAAMWIPMMLAMMLPAVAPPLWRYRVAVAAAGGRQGGWLCVVAGLAYFCAWGLIGLLIHPFGCAVATVLMQSPALARNAPAAAAIVIVLAGLLQFSAWKRRRLACCRATEIPRPYRHADVMTAWRYGGRLGLHCLGGCAGFTAALLAVGVMDWRAMLLATVAITAERWLPDGEYVARVIGAVLIVVGGGLFVAMCAFA